MTLIVVVALAAFLVIVLLALLLSRSRQREEWERFRVVSDMTSAWSREAQGRPVPQPSASGQVPEPDATPGAAPERDVAIDLRGEAARTTKSVDGR